MLVHNEIMYEKVMTHIGHSIVATKYGYNGGGVAIECEDCYEIIVDYDMPDNSIAELDEERDYHVVIPYNYDFYVKAKSRRGAIDKAHDSEGKMGEYDHNNIYVAEM